MKDPSNREILSRLYRLVESYETIPQMASQDEAFQFFGRLWQDSCAALTEAFPENEFATEFLIALNEAVGKRYKKQYPNGMEG